MNGSKSPKSALEAAQDLHRRGRKKEAESSYRSIISRNPQHSRALSSLGVLLCESGRIDEARQYLERATEIEANPRDLTNLGVVYRLQGKLDLAAEAFGRVLEVAPDFPDAELNLGIVLLDAGVHAQALSLLEQVLKREDGGDCKLASRRRSKPCRPQRSQ